MQIIPISKIRLLDTRCLLLHCEVHCPCIKHNSSFSQSSSPPPKENQLNWGHFTKKYILMSSQYIQHKWTSFSISPGSHNKLSLSFYGEALNLPASRTNADVPERNCAQDIILREQVMGGSQYVQWVKCLKKYLLTLFMAMICSIVVWLIYIQ